MPHNRTTRRALIASLSSVAAAGLASAGRNAEAGITVIDVNKTIGFGTGDLNSYAHGLPGGNGISFFTTTVVKHHTRGVRASGTGIKLRTVTGTLSRVRAGKTFKQVGTGSYRTATVILKNTNGITYVQGDNTSRIYSAFAFKNNGTTDYGWFSGTVDANYATLSYTIDQIVYDDTGAKIKTGQLTSAVPEPESAGLMMMGTLAIGGAAAVRRWKAGKAVAIA